MLMAAFNHAWDLLKALNPMPGEEGLPEEELRHYLNYMRQKENFTPQGRKKPQVMGEGAKVRSVADVQADIDSRIGTGQGGMLELLTERDKAPMQKAFAILKRQPPAFNIRGMQPFDEKQQKRLDHVQYLQDLRDKEEEYDKNDRMLLDKDIREHQDRMRVRMQQQAMNMMGNPSNINLMSFEEPLMSSLPSVIHSRKQE
tara:strand:+ start:371 stop:970 length:600 start_codon:yes stop_codon:yes gene_type:complete